MKDYPNIPDACYNCRVNKYIYDVKLPKAKYDEYQAKQFESIKTLDSQANGTDLDRLLQIEYQNVFGKIDYTNIKIHFNDLILNIASKVEESINNSVDPLLKAIKYAYVGNYIDYAALDYIDEDKLNNLIKKADDISFNYDNYLLLKEELKHVRKIVYLCDNCGEIVFDKILIKKLKQLYPNLDITAVVRGFDAMNDVTMSDALQVKLNEVCKVIDNGTDYMGTFLNKISKECLDLVKSADLIISKGQGNAESLVGSHLNIYYMFLCKCDHFSKKYNAKKFDPILAKEI